MPIPETQASNETRYDLLSLGEILLRFDPGDDTISSASKFRVHAGGGEFNVAQNLSKAFGMRTAVVSALVDNPIGRLAERLVREAGVDGAEIVWKTDDGTGRESRNGLYFIDRGFGVRGPRACFDRGNTAVSQIAPGEIDWKRIFADRGVRWFHTGGIYASLSETSPQVAIEAMQAARAYGAVVSFDLNFRESLWQNRGGRAAADLLNASILPFADIVFGIPGFDPALGRFDVSGFKRASEQLISKFPNIRACITTLRDVHSAHRHNLSAAAFLDGKVYRAEELTDLAVFDRVGSGDAFAAGVIHCLLSGLPVETGLRYGTAAAALTMTTPGDACEVSTEEIEQLLSNAGGAARR
jgi:2-dehydro-3-deoxygluconokinase